MTDTFPLVPTREVCHGGKKARAYPPEYKERIVELVRATFPLAAMCRVLGLSPKRVLWLAAASASGAGAA